MKQGIFVETKNVGASRRGLENLANRDRYQPGFMVVQGESDGAKTRLPSTGTARTAASYPYLRITGKWLLNSSFFV